MFDDDFPNIGGTGSLYDLRDAEGPAPRLAGLKSVSRAAVVALSRPAARPRPRVVGFYSARAR